MSGSSQAGKRTRRRYSDEFKRDAVGLVTEQGYPLAEAARRLDIHVSVLRNWKEKFMKGNDQNSKQNDKDPVQVELRQLREENRKLRMEREILKKAAAFFARESQ